MEPYRFDHIHLRSPDPDAAARVWMAAFGAEEKGRMQMAGGLRVVLDLVGLTVFIEQVAAGSHAPPGVRIAFFGMPDGGQVELIERKG